MRSVLHQAAGLVGDWLRRSRSRSALGDTRDPAPPSSAEGDLLDAISDTAIFRVDARGAIASWNAGARRLFGHDAADVLGRPYASLYGVAESARGQPERDLAEARERGRHGTAGWRARRDGSTFWGESTIHVVRAHPGGHVVVTRDATERHETEDELRLLETRYRTQSELAFEASFTIDAASKVFVELNESAVKLFGLPRKALLMRGLAGVSPPAQPDGGSSDARETALLEQAIAGERPATEWVVRDGDGAEVPCELRLARLPLPGRRLCRGSLTSISARKRAEELARLAAELVEQNRLAQAASRMKSEFVANMSHELRTPLNAILGFTELMVDGKAGELSPLQREFMDDILASGRHLLTLINGVLDLAKVEAGRLELHVEPTDLQSLAEEVTAVLASLATQNGQRLTVDADPEACFVHADPSKVKQILYNYVSNALKFSPRGGLVTVSIRPEGPQHVRLEVADEGIGIKAEDLPKLFTEFRQLESGPGKRFAGTGLGLALTKRLVELHGGHVGVTSRPGAGSRFSAVLPRQPSSRVSASFRPVRARRAALAIESDAADRVVVQAILTQAGFDVDTAETPASALALADERAYDAITIDVHFPGGDGLELVRTLRAQGKNTETPILVVSRVAVPEALAGLAVSAVLPKPVTREGLLGALRDAGGPPGAAPNLSERRVADGR